MRPPSYPNNSTTPQGAQDPSALAEEIRGALQCGNYRCACHNAGGNVHCPAHPDDNPSLSLDVKGGKLLWHCFAGCDQQAVKEALQRRGLLPGEAGDRSPSRPEELEAVYTYTDEHGKTLFQVCRFSGKNFRQRRPDGAGGWIYNLRGVRRVLYHLPQVREAVSAGQTIFVVEGEKDADNLATLGLVATTNPGGAEKWREEYTESLRGAAEVVILPDNDEPGRDHAKQVAQALYGAVGRVRVLELPGLLEKGDVSDWLAAGGTKDELLRLVAGAQEWKPTQPRREKTTAVDKRERVEKSFHEEGGILYEQIYRDGACLFLRYDPATEATAIVSEVVGGGTDGTDGTDGTGYCVVPISGEEIELGAVRLPSGIEEYGDTPTLLAEIEEYIYRYLDVSDSYRKFAAYYILLSWLYDRFNTLPYLRALGDTGCGKSRFLDVIGGLCYKAISASGCITPAPIYRMLRRWGGTLILDEADMKDSDEYNEVVTILNCGFERGRPVMRAVKDDPEDVRVLPVYGPKVFATRRHFRDNALEARCLTEVMIETTRTDIPAVLVEQFYKEQAALRNKLLLFRLRNYFRVKPEAAAGVDLGDIEPRLRQISEAFISLLANQPEALEDYRRFIRRHQQELIEQRAATTAGQVVQGLFARLEQMGLNPVPSVPSVPSVPGGGYLVPISAKDIAEDLHLEASVVGRVLKELGLHTKNVRSAGGRRRYLVCDPIKLATLRRRYIPEEGRGDEG